MSTKGASQKRKCFSKVTTITIQKRIQALVSSSDLKIMFLYWKICLQVGSAKRDPYLGYRNRCPPCGPTARSKKFPGFLKTPKRYKNHWLQVRQSKTHIFHFCFPKTSDKNTDSVFQTQKRNKNTWLLNCLFSEIKNERKTDGFSIFPFSKTQKRNKQQMVSKMFYILNAKAQ